MAATEGDRDIKGINRISVRGFKSLYDECSIEIRPLTILAGANSSGKSSIMQPLLLMKQTLEAPFDPGPLLLNGPYLKFTYSQQLFSRLSSKRPGSDSFDIKVAFGENLAVNSRFQSGYGKGENLPIEINSTVYEIKEEHFPLVIDSLNREASNVIPPSLKKLKDVYQNLSDSKTIQGIVKRNRCFLDLDAYMDGDFLKSINLSSPLIKPIQEMIHVSGVRGNPERTYQTTTVKNQFPGAFDRYVASIIKNWQNEEDPRLLELGNKLERLGLTWKIHAKQINDVQIELEIGIPGYRGVNDTVNIADVGFGVSQTLPVLVALLVAEPGQLVYLEQPEIHLHPRAQIALAEILAEAADRGVRVVTETHSELLLVAIQSLVAEEKLSPDTVKLHWFSRGDDGVTKVSSADLDDAGAFGDWPEDFGEVSLKLDHRYLNAAEERLMERSQ